MKKVLILMVLATSTLVSMGQKFGHIDSQALMLIVPGSSEAEAEITKKEAEHQAVLDNLKVKYQERVEAYQQNPPTEQFLIDVAVQEIQKLEMDFQDYSNTAQADMGALEQRLLQPLIDKAKTAIEEVGAENGFTYIFDSSVGVILYEGGEDVMPLVKTKLGITE